MGELFRQILPETPLPWTGERMVPGQTGAIEAEHYHRYFLARDLCRGKDVLDVASGEGYGSALLAQTARSVVGVELDAASVEHAAREYRSANLRFSVGEATKLPLDDHSVDVVVSFETIEHISDHQQYLREVKRVLRPRGFLLISTPDANVYSAPGTASNPFHVREMTEFEFREMLAEFFRNVVLVRQRTFSGSAVLPDAFAAGASALWVYEQRDPQTFEADSKLLRAPYLLALASDHALPPVGASLYIESQNAGEAAPELMTEMERLRNVESKFRELEPAAAKAFDDAAGLPALRAELERLRKVEEAAREQGPAVAKAMNDAAAIPAMTAELERLRALEQHVRDQALAVAKAMNDAAAIPAMTAELERLRKVEESAREQVAVMARLAGDAASARAEAEGYRRSAAALETEFQRTRSDLTATREDLAAAHGENTSLAEQRDRAREELSAKRSEIEAAMSLARQQSLTSQRSLMEVISVRQELDRCKTEYQPELDGYKAAYQEAADLLIPLRVRRALPEPLKTPLRAIKRALRSLTRRTP